MHAPRGAVSRLMRMDRKGVGPVCGRVADDLRAERGAGLFDGPRSIGVNETGRRKGHRCMTVVVGRDRGRLAAGRKAQLECVANTSETLWEACKLKERLRMILRQRAEAAAPMPRQWAADASLSGIEEFSRLGEKIDRRRFDILRAIRSGLPNARMEAVNNKIGTTIRMGCGYRSLGNLIALVMLKCGGLNLRLPGRQ